MNQTENQGRGSALLAMTVWSVGTILSAGCATTIESGPSRDLLNISRASSDLPDSRGSVSTIQPVQELEVSAQSVIATTIPAPCLAQFTVFSPIMAAGPPCNTPKVSMPVVRLQWDDLRLRPPLRQSWFHHPKLDPEGDVDELALPRSEVLAHRDHFRPGPLRNTYAGFRDQPLLHRDTSRAPETDSELPEIGPPPPRHTIKAFGTLTGLALIGLGVYALGPTSLTGVNIAKDKDDAWNKFQDAWTKPPVFDKDDTTVNYLGHPYFGSLYYLTQRNVGESPLYSFLFSAFTSACFEYFIESWTERPSATDLLVTPILGSILGELIFQATQEMRKDGFTQAEKILVTIINPTYVMQNGYR